MMFSGLRSQTAYSFLAFVIFFALVFSSTVNADTTKANNWLLTQVTPTGQVMSDNDIATEYQASSETLITLETLGVTSRNAFQPVKDFVLGSPLDNTEVLSRQIFHRVANQQTAQIPLDQILQRAQILKQRTFVQTGIGDLDHGDSTVIDTAFALQAISTVGHNSIQVSELVNYLLAQQNADGSFGNTDTDDANLYVTSQALLAMQGLRLEYSLDSQIASAVQALNSLKLASGEWGSAYKNAIALLAVIPTVTDLTSYQTAIDALTSTQQANGAWQDDAYITALAARALYSAEFFSAPTPASSGELTATVIDSATGLPLKNIMVTIFPTQGNPRQLVTNDDGDFIAKELAAGDYTVEVSATSYVKRELVATVTVNETLNLGNIGLSLAGGTVRGIVTDQTTGDPIANAMVTLSGNTTATTTTDANGQYSLSASLGNVTITVSAPTYDTVSGSGNIVSRGTLDFSPQLYLENTTPATLSSVKGVVIDQSNSAVLEDVNVSIVGQSSSVQTDVSGEFTLDNIDAGTIELSLTKSGYATRQFSIIVPKATVVDLSNIGLLEQQSADKAITFGQVLDADTQQPLTSTTITLSTGETLTSDADGQFVFKELDGGAYTIKLEKSGYLLAEYQFDLIAGSSSDLGQLLLRKEINLSVSSIQGVVIDQDTKQPVDGATVSIAALNLSATTNAQGEYQITNITDTNLDVSVSASGYFAKVGRVTLSKPKNATFDVELQPATPIANSDVVVNSVETDLASYPAFAEVELTAYIENQADTAVDTLFAIKVINSQGEIVEERPEVSIPLGGVISDAYRNIPANEEKQFEISWFSNALPAGDYQAVVQVLDAQGIRLLAENSTIVTIETTRAISGLAKFDPPLSQLAAQQSIDVTATLMNRGNVDLSAGTVTATVSLKNKGAASAASSRELFVKGELAAVPNPQAMAMDSSGNSYFLISADRSIIKVTPAGVTEVIITDLQRNARDIDIDKDDRLYVISYNNIDIFSADLQKSSLPLTNPLPSGLSRIEVMDNGDMLVANTRSVYQVQSDGSTQQIIGQGLGNGYRDIVKNSQGELLLSDVNANAVFKLENGQFSVFVEIDSAHGLAIDSQDNLYVTTYQSNGQGRLLKVSPSGNITEIATGLSNPYDVYIENDEQSFLVTNNQTHQVVSIDLAGNVTIIKDSTTYNPGSVAYNSNAELYVSNDSFRDIRKLSTDLTQAEVFAANSFGKLAFGASDQLYVASSRDIYAFSADGSSSDKIFTNSSSIISDIETSQQGVIVSDNAGRLVELDSTGNASLYAENPLYNSNTRLLEVDKDGAVYTFRTRVNNDLPAALIKINPSGQTEIISLDISDLQLEDIVISSQTNDFYASNRFDRTIMSIAADGTTSEIASLAFRPDYMALDETNNRLIISEHGTSNLHALNIATGAVELFVTTPQPLLGSKTLEIDSNGDFWGLNTSYQLMKISSDGLNVESFPTLGSFSSIHATDTQLLAIKRSFSELYSIALDGSASQLVMSNDNLRWVNWEFVIDNNNQLHVVSNAAQTRYLIIGLTDGVLKHDAMSFNPLLDIAVSGNMIIGITNNGVVQIESNRLPKLLSSTRYSHIESDVQADQMIVATARAVFRLNLQTLQVTELATGFQQMSSISIAPNGHIAVSESGNTNRLTILDSTGTILSQTQGIYRPSGIIRNDDGDIIISNTSPNNVVKIKNGAVSPLTNQVISSASFINRDPTDQSIYIVSAGSQIIKLDAANTPEHIGLNAKIGMPTVVGNILLQGNSGYAVNGSSQNVIGRNAFYQFDFDTGEVEQINSGIASLIDLESDNNELFFADNVKGGVEKINLDGSTAPKFARLPGVHALFIEQDGDHHVVYNRTRISKFVQGDPQQRLNYNLDGVLPTGNFVNQLVFINNRYYLATGGVVIAELGLGNNDQYQEGDILFTKTLDIAALPLGSDAISLDFGDWLPPIEGDFQLTINHSAVNNDLMNVLHVGGNASGTLNLTRNTVFPGDKLINGSLNITGADFTAVSQIDPDAVTLAASSGADRRAIAGDSKGNIYAASSNRIIKVTPAGETSDFVTGYTVGNGLAVDIDDNIYAIRGNDILKISPDGVDQVLTTLQSRATFVFVDHRNNIYASDQAGIYQIAPDGTTTLFKSVRSVASISKDRYDNMYVLQNGNKILKILPDGSISNYFTDAIFEYEGVNMVNDCADNVLFAPTQLDPFQPNYIEENMVIQVTGATGEVSQIFFGPPIDSALNDIDVLYYDRLNQRLLMYSDFSQGKIFSFPIVCGGIDVDVTLVTRDDVDLSLSNPAPTSEENLGNGQKKYIWDLEQVPNSGEEIELKYFFKDLLVGETRPALQDAYLEFTNTFDPDNVIKVPLTIPNIIVEQPMDLAVQLDKSAYVAFENIQITHTVQNNSSADFAGSLVYELIDSNDVIVHSFTALDVQQAANQLEQSFFSEWNTAQTIVGAYRLRSTLYDARGKQSALAITPFTISDDPALANSKGASLRTTTDRTVYHTSDTVEISDLVSNLSKNTVIDDVVLKIKIVNVADEVVYELDKPLSSLSADFSHLYSDAYTFENADEGEYRVQAAIVSAQNDVLAEDETLYTVQQNGIVALAGRVSLSQTTIKAGDSLMCTDVVTNNGSIAIDDLQIRQIIVDLEAPVIQNTVEAMVNLPSTQSVTNIRSVDTGLLGISNYACALQAYIDQQWVTLDTDYFAVTVAPTVLTANDDEMFTSRGAWGTVNVLANDQIKPSGDVDINVLSQPQNGNLINAGQGVFNFFPNITFNGQTEFQYQLEKDGVSSDPATVYIDVSPGLSCSTVPDHSVSDSQPVLAKNWAQIKGDPYDPPRYRIEVLGTSDNSVFVNRKTPNIDYPNCSLSYTVKPGKRTRITVEYRVKDVRTNGAAYTSRTKTFQINIDTRSNSEATTVLVPILQLLLLEDDK